MSLKYAYPFSILHHWWRMSTIMLLNGIAINLVNLWPLQLLFLFHIMMYKIDYRNQVKERCNWKQRRKGSAILGTIVRSLLSFSRQSSSALVMLQTQYSAMSFSSSIFVSMQIHIGLPCCCNHRTLTHHPTTTCFFEDESSYTHIFAWGCSSVFSSKEGRWLRWHCSVWVPLFNETRTLSFVRR